MLRFPKFCQKQKVAFSLNNKKVKKSMFKKTRHHQHLGELIGSGRSKVWQANVSLFAFEGAFSFQIWGEEEGLNAQQEQAVAQLFERLLQIKASRHFANGGFFDKKRTCLALFAAIVGDRTRKHLATFATRLQRNPPHWRNRFRIFTLIFARSGRCAVCQNPRGAIF